MILAQNLTRLRRRAKLTQAELAEASGVAQQTVSRLERGEAREPTYATVRALADALGVSSDKLASNPDPWELPK